jgi:hypothetical protein
MAVGAEFVLAMTDFNVGLLYLRLCSSPFGFDVLFSTRGNLLKHLHAALLRFFFEKCPVIRTREIDEMIVLLKTEPTVVQVVHSNQSPAKFDKACTVGSSKSPAGVLLLLIRRKLATRHRRTGGMRET